MANTPNTPDEPNFGNVDPDEAERILQEYAQALREEFETRTKGDPDNVAEYTKDFFKKHSTSAAAQIVHLMNNSSSESVQLNAAKYILDKALVEQAADDDPIKKLIEELTAPKVTTE